MILPGGTPAAGAAPLGAVPLPRDRTSFLVWAPCARRVEVLLHPPLSRREVLERHGRGYHHAVIDGVRPGTRYTYLLDGTSERADPASRLQPQGVHGPSQVVETAFPWEDASWTGPALEDYVIYELHVGTFSGGGTFEGILPHLDHLVELGVTAVELMPVHQFPGTRNWGYDGVFPFAVQHSYGGPLGLKRLVNACHRRGLAVVLDVVYNHVGPEGGVLADFGPYFTDHYRTPWGKAPNFDGPHSDEVRRFFLENALYFLGDLHVDALRLDAVHAIVDTSARPFLEELAEEVDRLAGRTKRCLHAIAESDLNDPRLLRPPELGGYGLHAQWSDDLHHALHALLTGERQGYYQDYGRVEHLARALQKGFVLAGGYSTHRRRRHGRPLRGIPSSRLVVFAQNHDQVGNRLGGERLSRLVSFEGLKLAAATVVFSPNLPLLFMGEEYGEEAPFYYFVDHSDPALIEAVRKGRKEEFEAFGWEGEPLDPQDKTVFLKSRLDHRLREKGRHRLLLSFYRELLRLRREVASLRRLDAESLQATPFEGRRALVVRRRNGQAEVFLAANFGMESVDLDAPVSGGVWSRLLASAEERWGGPGCPSPPALETEGDAVLHLTGQSLVLYEKKE